MLSVFVQKGRQTRFCWERSVVVNNVNVLLAGQPGYLLNGLQVLLETYPRLGELYIAHTIDNAIFKMRNHPIMITVFDSSFGNETIFHAIEQIRKINPAARFLVATEQFQPSDLGADKTLVMGFSAEELFKALDELFYLALKFIR